MPPEESKKAGEEPSRHHETSTIATLQSLIVAFVLAMTFRGFVTEGFVIPTGSMAPTLMGEHLTIDSEQTGFTFPLDASGKGSGGPVKDPMLGQRSELPGVRTNRLRTRMGDRILVLKSLYPFAAPNRFDVVVFKNPTDPDGDAENYIKRLVGLPDEAIWLLDGDVFVAPRDACDDLGAYEVQRKPEYVQRSVWQPVQSSEFIPINPGGLNTPWMSPWSGDGWNTTGRVYGCGTADPTSLSFDTTYWPINDWTAYNMLKRRMASLQNVSDVRIAAAITPDQDGLSTALVLRLRNHVFEFAIADGKAHLRYGPREGAWRTQGSYDVGAPRGGRVYDVEFWHVDQAMWLFVNRDLVGKIEYDWRPSERVEHAFGQDLEDWQLRRPWEMTSSPMEIEWRFEGSPVTLGRVRVDRDLFYLPVKYNRPGATIRLPGGQKVNNPDPAGHEMLLRVGTPGFGTHPDKPAILGPDHYFMLGDNSPASSDSRLWGAPHPYVATQIDDSPFLVHRKLLLGKAWVVYFPAPYPLKPNGAGVVPNFGKLRFIR